MTLYGVAIHEVAVSARGVAGNSTQTPSGLADGVGEFLQEYQRRDNPIIVVVSFCARLFVLRLSIRDCCRRCEHNRTYFKTDSGLITALIQDAVLTEFGGVPTYTALAIGPDEDVKIDELTRDLPLL